MEKKKVIVPEGCEPGDVCAFQMPSGTTIRIQVPPGSGPGSVLEVVDPGTPSFTESDFEAMCCVVA